MGGVVDMESGRSESSVEASAMQMLYIPVKQKTTLLASRIERRLMRMC